LLSTAVVNLFTKSVATIAGVAFTGAFFLIFSISERVNSRKHALAQQQMQEHFQLQHTDTVERSGFGVRPGNVLVTVRDYNTLNHLKWALERTDPAEQDIVVMSARVSQFGAAAYDLATEQIFSDYEQHLFTRAVSIAESFGKHVSLLVVPARDVWSAIVQTAINLESSAVVSGLSSKMSSQEQAFELGRAWEAAPEPKRQFVFQVVRPELTVDTFRIGPHTPTMKTEDVHLVHRLTRFAHQYAGNSHDEILKELLRVTDNPTKTRALADGLQQLQAEPPRPQPEEELGDNDGGPSSPPVVGP